MLKDAAKGLRKHEFVAVIVQCLSRAINKQSRKTNIYSALYFLKRVYKLREGGRGKRETLNSAVTMLTIKPCGDHQTTFQWFSCFQGNA